MYIYILLYNTLPNKFIFHLLNNISVKKKKRNNFI